MRAVVFVVAPLAIATGVLLGCGGSADDNKFPCCTGKREYYVCMDQTQFDLCERTNDTSQCVRDATKDNTCQFDMK